MTGDIAGRGGDLAFQFNSSASPAERFLRDLLRVAKDRVHALLILHVYSRQHGGGGARIRANESGGWTGARKELFNQIKTSLPRAHIVTAISFPEQNRELYTKSTRVLRQLVYHAGVSSLRRFSRRVVIGSSAE